MDGRRACYLLETGGEVREVGSKVTLELQPGEIVSYRTCGGGGFGPPEERDPSLVLKDAREGKVSLDRACDIYRVAIDSSSWSVDVVETARLREVKR